MKRKLFMGSTEVDPSRSASQISALLIQAGARSIQMDYDVAGTIVGMRFILLVGGVPYPFKMPARIEPVFEILQARRHPHQRSQNESRDRESAARIGWRQLFRWTEVQIAFVQSGMASAHEILLPYLVEQGGQTVFEVFEETRFKALPPAAKRA